MPKEEWGVKRVCPTTGKRFYDLNKTPIVSPYTGEVVELATGKARSIRPDTEDAESKKLKSGKSADNSESSGDDDNEDVVLEDDLLEDDDTDNVSLDEIADVESDENDM
ncbi:TIGR02300 family protein [Roseovarius tibetensis]|uniref:TIGR02300 family protein n=1 Tax=Roseovarius tibetensis TaxID=2685897 RepID=UPI003D7F3343